MTPSFRQKIKSTNHLFRASSDRSSQLPPFDQTSPGIDVNFDFRASSMCDNNYNNYNNISDVQGEEINRHRVSVISMTRDREPTEVAIVPNSLTMQLALDH